MEVKLFLEDQVESVFEFEQNSLSSDLNEIQREMATWEKPWRKESLEHYSKLGWSFLAIDEHDKVQGYILGQPVLFFNNWTQTLWIENLSFKDNEVGFQLLDTVIKWSKTKHLQKVILNSSCEHAGFAKESFDKFQEGGYLHLSTTKLHEG